MPFTLPSSIHPPFLFSLPLLETVDLLENTSVFLTRIYQPTRDYVRTFFLRRISMANRGKEAYVTTEGISTIFPILLNGSFMLSSKNNNVDDSQ